MIFNDKGLTSRAAGLLAFLNILAFALYYVFSYIVSAPNDFVVYLVHFTTNTITLLLPLISASVLLIKRTYVGKSPMLVAAIPLAITKIIYLVPYYYMFFIYSGYDSIESLTMGALWSIPEIAFLYGETVLLAVGMRLISDFIEKRAEQPRAFHELIAERPVLDLDNSATLSIFCVGILTFIYLFVKELVNAISYFVEYAGSYKMDEILYIAFSFIYDVLMLLIVHLVMCAVKNHILSKRLYEAPSEGESNQF